MALIVEDGTGLSTAESYLSVSDADAYHDAHSAPAAWTSASDSEKEAALRRATEYLDQKYHFRWLGIRKVEEQALDWPRTSVLDRDGYEVDDNSLPRVLKNATAILALKVIEGDTLFEDVDQPGNLTAEKIVAGPVEISQQWATGLSAEKQYTEVQTLVARLLNAGGSSEVVRG